MTPLSLFPERETREQAERRLSRAIRDAMREHGEASGHVLAACARGDETTAQRWRDERERLSRLLDEYRAERASWLARGAA